MKHIIKVNNIQDAKDRDIRPIIALDNSGVLFFERTKGIPEGFVDLGLASGTLWSTKNIGATNGDTAESWYGNYYAWGEIETKDNYEWTTYKYAVKANNKLTKYCSDPTYGNRRFTDELTQLVREDDVATVTNSAWRMPSRVEIEELIALPNIWVTNYDPSKSEHTTDDGGIQGLNGRVFSGNGNTLFIPAAGHYVGSSISDVGSTCDL